MDRDTDALTALLLDPFLTTGEAEREAAATPRRDPREAERPARRRPVSRPANDNVRETLTA